MLNGSAVTSREKEGGKAHSATALADENPVSAKMRLTQKNSETGKNASHSNGLPTHIVDAVAVPIHEQPVFSKSQLTTTYLRFGLDRPGKRRQDNQRDLSDQRTAGPVNFH